MKKKPASFYEFAYLLFLAVITACGDAFFQGDRNGLTAVIAKTLVYFFLFYGFFLIAERLFCYFQNQTIVRKWHRYFQFSKGNILRISFFLFAVYFLYLLVFYPGATTGDTMYQIEDLYTRTSPMPYPMNFGHSAVQALMTDHHPVLTTLIFTMFYRIGLLFGDPNIGLFLYNLLQILSLSLLFAAIVCYMDRLRIPKPIALISTAFYASPVIASFAITMGKDMVFAFCFVLYYLVFIRFVLNPDESSDSKKEWLLLALLSVLISLTNKKGMYLALLSDLCLLLVIPGKKKLLAIPTALLPVFTVVVIMQQILFPVFNIIPGGKQEILGVAFQQTALSILEHPENYTEEEKDLFFSMLDLPPEDLPEVYNPNLTDSVKDRYLFETDSNTLRSYLKMWAIHFFYEPGTYFRAILSIGGGYLAPLKAFNVYQYVPYSDVLGAFSQSDKMASLRTTLGAFLSWIDSIPFLSIFAQDSFYVFWFPAFSLYSFCRQKQWKRIIILVPLTANLLFLMIGPCCYTRYALCQLYTFPVLLAVTALPTHERETEL